mgnify:FL=1
MYEPGPAHDMFDLAPGEERRGGHVVIEDVRGYVVGLLLAAGLTAASFHVTGTDAIWRPAVPVALVVLAIAQMAIHLVFFLHISTGPDSTNNVMALAFGVLVVGVVIIGSLWIMANLNANMMPMDQLMRMQR